MRANSLFITLLLIFSLSACSTVSGWFAEDSYEEPPEALTEFTAEFEPQVLWDKSTGDGADGTKTNLPAWWQNDLLFTTDIEGDITAINADSGKVVWDNDLDTRVITGVGGGMGMIFVGTQKGVLIALQETDGAELWRSQLTSEVLAPATASNLSLIHISEPFLP